MRGIEGAPAVGAPMCLPRIPSPQSSPVKGEEGKTAGTQVDADAPSKDLSDSPKKSDMLLKVHNFKRSNSLWLIP